MPLPGNNETWPPHRVAAALDTMRTHSAWYAGDPQQLASVYSLGAQTARADKPSQYAGGVVGTLARWWWGQPTQPGETRSKLHVPLASDIATASADMLFADPPKVTSDDGRVQDALDSFTDDGLHASLNEAAEVNAALGGAFLREVWDGDVSDMPWVDVVHADAGIPEFRWGKLTAVTFWQVVDSPTGAGVWRALERHEPGRIFHGLYVGTHDKLGSMRPLAEHPETAHLADLVDEDGGYSTGVPMLTAQYVPNMRPNRADRGSQLGRSDYAGVEPLFDALDEAYSSWHRDIRLGKARVMVPEAMLDTDGPGSPAEFQLDRELFVGLRMLDKGTGDAITAQQFAIRYQEHADTCRDWTQRAVEAAGYSAATFGNSGDVPATATEVKARERRTYRTRGKKTRYWTPALVDALRVWVALANAHFGARLNEGASIDVEFPDAVHDDTATLAATAQTLRAAEAASTETVVRMIHPDWDTDQVAAEVAAIGAGTVDLPAADDTGL